VKRYLLFLLSKHVLKEWSACPHQPVWAIRIRIRDEFGRRKKRRTNVVAH